MTTFTSEIFNAEVLFREDCSPDEFIDVIVGNRVYMPCLYVSILGTAAVCHTEHLHSLRKATLRLPGSFVSIWGLRGGKWSSTGSFLPALHVCVFPVPSGGCCRGAAPAACPGDVGFAPFGSPAAATSAQGFSLLVPCARGHLTALFDSNCVYSEIKHTGECVANGELFKSPNLNLGF